jgi:hypothetical protein
MHELLHCEFEPDPGVRDHFVFTSPDPFPGTLLITTAPSRHEKKADVVEHPEVCDHVGLLVDGPPGTAGLPFI